MRSFYGQYGKSVMDEVICVASVIILSPILLLTAALILLIDGRPILFIQERLGKHRKKFYIYKFRTMKDSPGPLLCLDSDKRVTKLGRFLRKYKIDELPQLLNIIKGDMSLVGFRPEVPKLMKKFPVKYEKLFEIKPGITGLGSIGFIDEYKMLPKSANQIYTLYQKKILPSKLKLEYQYLDKISLKDDLWILWKTGIALFRQFKGGDSVNHSTTKTCATTIENSNLARN